jgi:uncharacterized membrane protein YbhN (UPF0104 family)
MQGASVPSLIFLGLLVLFALLPLALQLRNQANVDSPWFWAYWFGIFALVALFLASPKFQVRQAHIEREFQGRTRAAQNLRGDEPDVELSEPGRTEITLWPLFAGLTAVTIVSWLVYYLTRKRPEPPLAESPEEPKKAIPA